MEYSLNLNKNSWLQISGGNRDIQDLVFTSCDASANNIK